jgi:hypothetical protein
MVHMGNETTEVFKRMRLLCKPGAWQNEADLRFITDELKKLDYTVARDSKGRGLIHIAAAGGRASLVSFLMAKGFDINSLGGRTRMNSVVDKLQAIGKM